MPESREDKICRYTAKRLEESRTLNCRLDTFLQRLESCNQKLEENRDGNSDRSWIYSIDINSMETDIRLIRGSVVNIEKISANISELGDLE